MNKFLQSIFFVCVFMFSFNYVKATNVLGAEAHWKSLGNDTFEITLIVYRRCTDSGPVFNLRSYPPTLMSDSCANAYSVSFDTARSYITDDITQVCPTQQSPCAISGGSGMGTSQIPFGVERHTILYKVYLGGNFANCCWYKLRWQTCCRNSNITTGYGDSSFIDEFWLNRCVANSSPRMNTIPMVMKCASNDITYNAGAVDDELDSLSYTLEKPLGGNYTSPWSATYPFTCLGGNNPNPNATPPTGFCLNPSTGDILFRPLQVQISVVKLVIREWRKIGGVVKLLSVTNRDIQIVIIQNCNNKLPTVSITTPGYFCAGDQMCFTINTNDADANDTTRIIHTNASSFHGSSLTLSSNTVQHGFGTFCWTPDSNDVRSKPYNFVTGVADNHCPLMGEGYEVTSFLIIPKLFYQTQLEKISCSDYNFKASNSYPLNIYRKWEVFKGSTLIDSFLYTDTVYNYKFKYTGTYYIKYTGTNLTCTRTITDSVVITNVNVLNVVTNPDTLVCLGNNITLSAIPLNGQPPFTYKWFLNGTLINTSQSFSTTPGKSGQYIINVISSDTCNMNNTDTVNITIDTLRLQIQPLRDTVLCNGQTINLSPKVISGKTPLQYKWFKNGSLISTASSLLVAPSLASDYVLNVISSDLCNNFFTDTIHIDVDYSQLSVQLSMDTLVCIGASVNYAPVITLGKPPFTFQWFKNGALISTATTVSLSPTVSSTYNLTIYSSDACYNLFKDTFTIRIDTAVLRVDRLNDTTVCSGTNLDFIPLIKTGKPPYQFQWYKDGVPITTASKLSITPMVTSDYVLNVTSSDLCFNRFADTFHIDVDTSHLLIATMNDTTICEGTGINVAPTILSGNPPFQYQWFKNGVLISSSPPLLITLMSGADYILKVNSSDKCHNQFSDTFSIKSFPLKQLVINAGSVNLMKGQSTILKSNGKNNFLWSGLYIVNNWGDSVMVKPIATSTYTLISDNVYGCRDTAQITINVSTVGVKTNHIKNEVLKINPNPASVEINVSCTLNINSNYSVLNILGQEQFHGTLKSELTAINISSLKSGVYFFKVGQEVRKFIKQ